MGNFIKKPSKVSSARATKRSYVTSKKITHKATVLTTSDVEANRSMAYSYLSF